MEQEYAEMNIEFVPPLYQLKRMSVGELDRIATRLMSIYIRTRDVNKDGYVKCFTCKRTLHWREMQCGHYAPRSNMCTKFLEVNNNPQCGVCNMTYRGNLAKYKQQLDRKYGRGMADYITELSQRTCKYTRGDMVELIRKLEKKLQL